MKIDWKTVVSTLNLCPQQANIARYLINRGKDRCLEMWELETSDQELAPLQYAGMLCSHGDEIEDDGARSAAFILYLATKKIAGEEVSYLQWQYEHEESIKNDLKKVLAPDQILKFESLGLGTILLDIDTEYSPINDRVRMFESNYNNEGQRKASETAFDRLNGHDTMPEWNLLTTDLAISITGITRPGLDWVKMCNELDLSQESADPLRYFFDRFQGKCTALWMELAENCDYSPMEYVVSMLLQDLEEKEVENRLIQYLSQMSTLLGGTTYLQSQNELEREVYREVQLLLNRAQLERMLQLSIHSFLNIDTGCRTMTNVMGDLLEETKLKRGIDIFCAMPFEYAHIEDTGDVLPCCPSKFKFSIGNLKRDTLHDVWNSTRAHAVRESILNKSFRFCDYNACEYLKQAKRKNG
jgi:hypothetical protein